MAIRAWMDGDLRLALRLLQWAEPTPRAISSKSDDSGLTFQVA